MSSTPFTELSNSVAVDVPSFPLRRWIRLGGAMGCESCVKFRTDNRTPGFLSFSGLDCASAICLPVHGSLEAFGWKHSLIAGTPLPFDGSPRLSIGVVVISGLDRDLAGYWCRSSMLAGTRDEDAYQCLRHLPFSTTLLEPEDRALQVWKVVVRVLDSNSV